MAIVQLKDVVVSRVNRTGNGVKVLELTDASLDHGRRGFRFGTDQPRAHAADTNAVHAG